MRLLRKKDKTEEKHINNRDDTPKLEEKNFQISQERKDKKCANVWPELREKHPGFKDDQTRIYCVYVEDTVLGKAEARKVSAGMQNTVLLHAI